MAQVTRLGLYGGPRFLYPSFANKEEAIVDTVSVFYLSRNLDIIFLDRNLDVSFGGRNLDVEFGEKE